MKIKIIGSTHPEFIVAKQDALLFSGKAAGVCYLPENFGTLNTEPTSRTRNRVSNNLKSGHHSVFGHVHYNLVIEDAPKILAMLLNNEKIYNTSEKSARYTQMAVSGQEKKIVEKWTSLLQKEMWRVCPQYSSHIFKLAQENARYFISVFTPVTTMVYTASLAQLNFIMFWAKEFINKNYEDSFSNRLKDVLKEFLEVMPDVFVEGLDDHMKKRSFSLLGKRFREEQFGESYSVNYLGTFAQLAQAQRHRTLSYEMMFPSKNLFHIPLILKDNDWLYDEWISDMNFVANSFPQGMLVQINERGTLENFALKCTERLCGAAQLEIALRTKNTLRRYLKNTEYNYAVHDYLEQFDTGARCTFDGWKCEQPCIFGAKFALNRVI